MAIQSRAEPRSNFRGSFLSLLTFYKSLVLWCHDMKIRTTKTKVVFKDVLNESLLDTIATAFHQVKGLKSHSEDFGTTQAVEGTPEQIEQFIKAYDKEVGA